MSSVVRILWLGREVVMASGERVKHRHSCNYLAVCAVYMFIPAVSDEK
jgi:hypothetical protein